MSMYEPTFPCLDFLTLTSLGGGILRPMLLTSCGRSLMIDSTEESTSSKLLLMVFRYSLRVTLGLAVSGFCQYCDVLEKFVRVYPDLKV